MLLPRIASVRPASIRLTWYTDTETCGSEKENCLGGKCIHMSDAISGVSIAPTKAQTPEDMKVLEYLAGLRFAEK